MGEDIPDEPPGDVIPPAGCPDIDTYVLQQYNVMSDYDTCEEMPCAGVAESVAAKFTWIWTDCEECPYAFYAYISCDCLWYWDPPFSKTYYTFYSIFQGCTGTYGEWPD